MSDNDDPALLAPGYALGILTPEETVAYEAHLVADPNARDESDAYVATAAALGLDTPPIAPPASLKDGLMARIATTPQLPATAVETPDAATAVAGASAPPVPAPGLASAPALRAAGPVETAARRRWFARPATVLVAAAAAVLLFVGGIAVGGTLANQPSVAQQQASALARISSAPDARRATGAVAGGGDATLVWSASLGTSALLVDDLASLPQGKTYQLWYIRGTTAISAGTFESSGGQTSWRVLSGTMQAGDTVGVTVEPAGGSKAPTTKPVIAIRS